MCPGLRGTILKMHYLSVVGTKTLSTAESFDVSIIALSNKPRVMTFSSSRSRSPAPRAVAWGGLVDEAAEEDHVLVAAVWAFG